MGLTRAAVSLIVNDLVESGGVQGQELARLGKRTVLSELPSNTITAQDVAEAARRGDLHAQGILSRAGTFIGIAIADLINLFNPSIVIIGGGVAQVGHILTNPIRQAVRERAMRASEQSVRITTAMLGRRSILMGAIVQAVNVAIHSAAEGKNARNSESSIRAENEAQEIQVKGGDVIVPN